MMSLLDQISQQVEIYREDWRNGMKGAICDIKCNGVFRFIEMYRGENGMLNYRNPNHENDPIVCVGIAAHWLIHRKSASNILLKLTPKGTSQKFGEGVRQMYENYTEMRFNQFKDKLNDSADTWEWEEEDWKRFFYLKASEREAHWNKMSEPLFDFITESDAQRVRPVMDNYIKYLDKCREAYQTSSTDEEKEKLLDKIHIYFKDEETAKRFLKQLEALDKDEAKIELVKKYKDSNLCLNTSKALWQALYDTGLYGKGYPNWNKQMNPK